MIEFHRKNKALVTIALKRVPTRWSSASSSPTTRAGSSGSSRSRPGAGVLGHGQHRRYIMEPEVLDHVATGQSVDWSNDVFPQAARRRCPLYGYVTEAYWEDVGNHESYLRARPMSSTV